MDKNDNKKNDSFADLISVVVPVYNVEGYLDNCMRSIVLQTYANIEIILVDDGSTDLSGKKCDEWAKKDGRVRVIHKQNGGLSSARNAGIDVAKGDYIAFVDSDDFIALNMYEIMHREICLNNSQMACVMLKKIEYTEEQVATCRKNADSKTVTPEEALYSFLMEDYKTSSCNKLFLKNIFNELRFPEGMLYEDTWIITDILKETTRVTLIDEYSYYYISRNDSIDHRALYARELDEKEFDILESYKKMLDATENYYPRAYNAAIKAYYHAHIGLFTRMIMAKKCDKELYEMELKYMKDHSTDMLKAQFSLLQKVAIIALRYNVRLYKLIVLLKIKVFGW